MFFYENDSDFQMPAKKYWFGKPTDDVTLASYSKVFVPRKTALTNAWAKRAFMDWIAAQNKQNWEQPDQQCQENILESSDAAIVNRWLSLFVIEVRNKKGQPYPPSTIHQLLCGLQRVMQQEHNVVHSSFLTRPTRS